MLYESAIIITTIVATAHGNALNLPFKSYGQNCVRNGIDVTYRLDSLKPGDEVLCKVDYRAEPHANPDVLVEKDKAEKFAGNLGNDWSKLKVNADYIKHYPITKETALATTDDVGVTTPYDGVDKDEVVKFTQWEEITEEVAIGE